MALTLHEMLEALFGIKSFFKENPEVTQVQTTPTRILPYNPMRVSAIVFNMGGTIVYLAPNNLVNATHGIVLAANGGNMVIQWDKDFELCSSEWFGMSTVACNIYTLENIAQ